MTAQPQNIRLTDLHPQSPIYRTDRRTPTKPNRSDFWAYSQNISDGHTPTKPNISDWWKYTHISNCWTYIHKAYPTDGGTATKTNTSDWQTYIDKNPAYQTDRVHPHSRKYHNYINAGVDQAVVDKGRMNHVLLCGNLLQVEQFMLAALCVMIYISLLC